MARVIFEGLTKKQAKTLAEWYEGQGEQDADVWFDCKNVKTPMTDVQLLINILLKSGGFCNLVM